MSMEMSHIFYPKSMWSVWKKSLFQAEITLRCFAFPEFFFSDSVFFPIQQQILHGEATMTELFNRDQFLYELFFFALMYPKDTI